MPPEIPNRSLFRQPEVCEIAQVQPYVLRSWESEFPDLGVSKGTARVYRRSDLELVLRIRQLVFVEGLTLAGARRRLDEERPSAAPDSTPLDELLGNDARERLQLVKAGLRGILQLLRAPAGTTVPFQLESPARPTRLVPSPSKQAAAGGRAGRATAKPRRSATRGR